MVPGMKLFASLALALVSPILAVPGTSSLTLVSESGFNKLTITIDPQVSGIPVSLASTSTTTLTGSLIAELDSDPLTGKTRELTLHDGRVNGTPLRFTKSVFPFGKIYDFLIEDISAAIFTLSPPGLVTLATGDFAADQHAFSIDQGHITGVVNVPGEDPVTIDQSFTSETAMQGTGSGTGSIILTPIPSLEPELYRNFDVVLTMPVALDDTFADGDPPIRFTANGTIKATGKVQVALSDYLAWTMKHGIRGASGGDDSNHDGISNAMAWALGLDATQKADLFLLKPNPSVPSGFLLSTPPTLAPIRVQCSTLLGDWTDVPSARLSSGTNPIPAGSSGLITIAPSEKPTEFLRLKVDE